MADYHVWICDECSKEIQTHNDDECSKLPNNWAVDISDKGLSCEDCTTQLKLLRSAVID